MSLKWVFAILASLSATSMLRGQESAFSGLLTTIDSLIDNNKYEEAEKKADSLYLLLSEQDKSRKHTEVRLEVMLRRGEIMHNTGNNERKALEILLKTLDEATSGHFYKIAFLSELNIALVHEKVLDWNQCRKHLNRAYALYLKNNLEAYYSTYCIRSSSYYRFRNNTDSAVYFAGEALAYAREYDNKKDLADAYLLSGILSSTKNEDRESINYYKKALNIYRKKGSYDKVAFMYNNISISYCKKNNLNNSLKYNDSALMVYNSMATEPSSYIWAQRCRVFESLGNMDSAYHYLNISSAARIKELRKKEATEIKRINEQYENDKKEAIIKSRNLWLGLALTIVLIIATTSILFIRQNRRIRRQNALIQNQIQDLSKLLDQKEVLLSELQHRVKNNLLQVISLLEIQKESAAYNNMDEVIRENQNRIRSMALLHSKLKFSDNSDYIDFETYLGELSELVKESYRSDYSRINVSAWSGLKNMPIDTAIPLGLIIVELMSNSIKHAFGKHTGGNIHIAVSRDEAKQKNKLDYTDNGTGFDFNATKTEGLGLEIIKGLAEQLNGKIITNKKAGFQIIIYF